MTTRSLAQEASRTHLSSKLAAVSLLFFAAACSSSDDNGGKTSVGGDDRTQADSRTPGDSRFQSDSRPSGDNLPAGDSMSSGDDIPTIPDWSCDPDYYGTGDGCDCGCGMIDPDCDLGCAEPGCAAPSCQFCYDAAGDFANCPATSDWTCDTSRFRDAKCDCGCTVLDPDCNEDFACTAPGCNDEGCDYCWGAGNASGVCPG